MKDRFYLREEDVIKRFDKANVNIELGLEYLHGLEHKIDGDIFYEEKYVEVFINR